MSAPILLTSDEVSTMTRLPIETLRYYRHKGVGPKGFLMGRRLVYKRADVEAWIEAKYAEAMGA